MSIISQTATVVTLCLRGIPERRGPSAVIVVGMACVVTVLISLQAMRSGVTRAMDLGAMPDRAVVTSKGAATTPAISSLSRADVLAIMDTPGIKHDAAGVPIASPVIAFGLPVRKKSDGFTVFATLVGEGPQALVVWHERQMIAGQMYQAGVREVTVGRSAQRQFEGLEIGDKLIMPGGDWTVVGVFTTGDASSDSTLTADADTLMSALRMSTFKIVNITLENPAAFDRVKDALTTNPTLNVDIISESDQFAESARNLNGLLGAIALLPGGLMSVGAMFGALNTMFSAVSDRQREIGTLRAIGFSAVPVVISVFVEAMLLAALGALIGGGLAWIAFNNQAKVMGGLVIRLAVTPSTLGTAIAIACGIALLGGLFPAIRAARLSIVDSLRAT